MAAEYQVQEVGFIGAIWQGKSNSPLPIGKTLEVRNIVMSTGLLGNTRMMDPGTIYFTEIDKKELTSTLEKLNSYLPENLYFEIGSLPPHILNDIVLRTKIERRFFLERTKILFRYDKSKSKEPGFSNLQLQYQWEFDTTNENTPKIKFVSNSVKNIKFSFLVDTGDIDKFTEYFSLVDSNDVPLFRDGFNPSVNILNSGVSDGSIKLEQQRSILNNDQILLSTDVDILPPKPNTPKVYTFPAADEEFLSKEQSKRLFEVNKSLHLIFSLDDFNQQMSSIKLKTTALVDAIKNKAKITTLPESGPDIQAADTGTGEFYNFFTSSDEFAARVQYEYWNLVTNYMYEQLGELYGSIPTTNPDGWEIDENGNLIKKIEQVTVSPELLNTAIEDRKDLDEFDSLIDEMIEDLTIDDNNIYVFKKVTKVADYSLPILRYKTKGLFRCTGEKLSTYHTGSLTEKQQKYYLTVFNEKQYTNESYHQFDVSYCHISGSGSSHIEGEVDLYPAKSMYRKYMLECFGHTNGKFPFKNGVNGDYFYTIQLPRDQFKEKIDMGNFEIALCELSSSGTTTHPSSSRFFTLIDESKDSKQEIVTNEGIQEYYYITSGSIRDGIYNETEDNAWGVVFPKMGLIVLDGVVLDQSCSFNTITGSTDGQNSKRLFLSISGAAVPTSYRPSGSFFARSFETFLTETYFCRAEFNEFNHSTNYTYMTGSDGFIKYDYFKSEPHSYITTVGLYNRQKELLAVGKLRNPIKKNDGKVCIFEVVLRLN